jgi:CheY-like chemotaxis protein
VDVATPGTGSNPAPRRLRAVICDDDGVLRNVVTRLLEDSGFDVLAETDRPHEAVELARRFQVDLLVLDLSLPLGRGEDALHAVRDLGLSTRVVVFSNYTDSSLPLLTAGAYDVIEKPDFDGL